MFESSPCWDEVPATHTLSVWPEASRLPLLFPWLQNGANHTHLVGFCGSKMLRRVSVLKHNGHSSSPSGLCAPGTHDSPQLKPLPLQLSPPKGRELKHAITQLPDGKCFGNFQAHLLLNLILSSVAHYARDGISCGLPGAPHTSRRQPHYLLLLSLVAHERHNESTQQSLVAPLDDRVQPGHFGTGQPTSPIGD